MHTDTRDCEILGNQCTIIGRFLPGIFDQASKFDFRLMRLAPEKCDPELFLEKNRSKVQHVIFVFRTTFGSVVTVIEIRNNQGGGWFDRDLATNIAKTFIRNVRSGLV